LQQVGRHGGRHRSGLFRASLPSRASPLVRSRPCSGTDFVSARYGRAVGACQKRPCERSGELSLALRSQSLWTTRPPGHREKPPAPHRPPANRSESKECRRYQRRASPTEPIPPKVAAGDVPSAHSCATARTDRLLPSIAAFDVAVRSARRPAAPPPVR
jgi:hypothetical protein